MKTNTKIFALFMGLFFLSCSSDYIDQNIETKNILKKVEKQGLHLIQELALIPGVKEVRGAGLLIGIELEDLKATDVANDLREAGILVNAANATTIRLAPALIVTDAQIAKFLAIFKKVVAHAK